MYRSYKFRLYPSKTQKELLSKSFGCTRLVYNYYLSEIKNNNYQNAFSNIKDYANNLKYKYVFLQEIDTLVIRNTIINLDNNIKRCWNNNFGYPKYKCKFGNNSYTTTAIYQSYKPKGSNEIKTYCES